MKKHEKIICSIKLIDIKQFFILGLINILILPVELNAQMNIRVRGSGIDISNVGSSDKRHVYPLATRTEWEHRYFVQGKYHYFETPPGAIANKDYATTAITSGYFGKDDSRKEYSLDSFLADKPGFVTIAVPAKSLNEPGWIAVPITFSSSIDTYRLYRYHYTDVGTWVNIPKTSSITPTLIFADKGHIKFDNPLKISELANGVIITRNTGVYNREPYIVDPYLLVLPNGDYIAGAHAELSFEQQYEPDSDVPRLWISKNKGKTWSQLSQSKLGVLHASIFYHKGALYALGDIIEGYGGIVKSLDGGRTWSDPVKLNFKARNSPSHVVFSNGRLWLAMESPVSVISASASSNLMNPDSWVIAKRKDNIRTGNEADIVITKNGYPVILPKGSKKIRVLSPNETIVENEVDSFNLIGSGSKYSAIYDSISDKYWALTSYSPIEGNVRTGVVLSSSSDLKTFTIEKQVIQGKSNNFHGFNYSFLQIDGNDIVFVVRTAWENEMGQAQRWHDANMLTFHRIRNFRKAEK